MEFINNTMLGLFVGGIAGLFIGNFVQWNRREDFKETFTLSELTDMMAKKMIQEENEQAKSDRADRVRHAVRDIVRKEFENNQEAADAMFNKS